jgi:hypothetical protein
MTGVGNGGRGVECAERRYSDASVRASNSNGSRLLQEAHRYRWLGTARHDQQEAASLGMCVTAVIQNIRLDERGTGQQCVPTNLPP